MKRTSLQQKKAENLVFVHNNLRLLLTRLKNTKKWDIGAEIADFDASASRLTMDDLDDFDVNTIVAFATDLIGLSSSNAREEEEEEEYEEEDED